MFTTHQVSCVTSYVSHVMCRMLCVISHMSELATPKKWHKFTSPFASPLFYPVLIINRPGVALFYKQLCYSFAQSSFVEIYLQNIITPKLVKLGTCNFDTMLTNLCVSCVMCHVSCVTCHVSRVMRLMSRVTCPMSKKNLLIK